MMLATPIKFCSPPLYWNRKSWMIANILFIYQFIFSVVVVKLQDKIQNELVRVLCEISVS